MGYIMLFCLLKYSNNFLMVGTILQQKVKVWWFPQTPFKKSALNEKPTVYLFKKKTSQAKIRIDKINCNIYFSICYV